MPAEDDLEILFVIEDIEYRKIDPSRIGKNDLDPLPLEALN